MTRSNRKQTVVILSAKPLDTTRLKQSLKKHGTDEDFFPFDAHVKLRFDAKGALLQTAIHADGANIIGSGDSNIKVTATIKDGTVKGKAGMDKPGKFFKMMYQFEVAFDAAVIPLPGAAAQAEPEPKTKPKTTTTTPVKPGEPALATDKELRFEGKLTKESPTVAGKPAQVHRVKLSADKTYLIDLQSEEFDTYLRILDSSGKQLASDDDGGEDLNARLRFTPPKEDTYQIVATRFGGDQGSYLLKIRPLGSGAPARVAEKELRFDGKLTNESPMVLGKPGEIHQVKMSRDRTYLIDLESTDFDPYLRILDSTGKQVAKDDDGGENRNARLRFTPLKDDTYQVVATRFASRQGSYVLKIRVLRAGEER
jgi:hypothetical protein